MRGSDGHGRPAGVVAAAELTVSGRVAGFYEASGGRSGGRVPVHGAAGGRGVPKGIAPTPRRAGANRRRGHRPAGRAGPAGQAEFPPPPSPAPLAKPPSLAGVAAAVQEVPKPVDFEQCQDPRPPESAATASVRAPGRIKRHQGGFFGGTHATHRATSSRGLQDHRHNTCRDAPRGRPIAPSRPFARPSPCAMLDGLPGRHGAPVFHLEAVGDPRPALPSTASPGV